MTDHLHPGPHPDADQLNAFIEDVLPEHERLQSLAHFAECARCRELIFLAQEPSSAPPDFVAEPLKDRPLPIWRRWFTPVPVLTAAFAVALLAALSLYLHRSTSAPRGTEISTLQPPPVPAPPPPAPQTPGPPKVPLPQPAPSSAMDTNAASTAGNRSASATQPYRERYSNAPAPSSETSSVAGAVPMSASAPITVQPVQPPSSNALAAGAAAPPPTPQVAELELARQLPLNDRNMTALKMTRAPAESTGPLRLRIEHNSAPAGTISQITGAVVDPSGAAVSGATVLARSPIDATSIEATTDASGKFALVTLSAGEYDLQITAPGFAALSQQIELQPYDVALLSPVLQIGSVSQTVEVSNQSAMLELQSPIPGKRSKPASPLPGKLQPATSVSIGDRTLTLDSAGDLFLSRNGGKHWKTVKPQWQGTISTITAASSLPSTQRGTATPAPPVFKLTTNTNAIWISQDGLHWRPNPTP